MMFKKGRLVTTITAFVLIGSMLFEGKVNAYDDITSKGTFVYKDESGHEIILNSDDIRKIANKLDENTNSVNSKLTIGNTSFYFDCQNGQYGYNTSPTRETDTFHSFGDLNKNKLIDSLKYSSFGFTTNTTEEQIYETLAKAYPATITRINPRMTSNSSSNCTVTGSGTVHRTRQPYTAFNYVKEPWSDSDACFAFASPSYTIYFKYPTAKIAKYMNISIANYSDCYVSSCTIQARNGSNSWTTLASNVSLINGNPSTTNVPFTNNNTAYQEYAMTFYKSNSLGIVSEIEMYGYN